jgi:hypothetical protein
MANTLSLHDALPISGTMLLLELISIPTQMVMNWESNSEQL